MRIFPRHVPLLFQVGYTSDAEANVKGTKENFAH